MNKAELDKEAEQFAEKHAFRVPYDGSNKFYDDTDYKASKDGYIAGATEATKELQEENLKLEAKVRTLEIEQHYCMPNCSKVTELEAQIEKMKCCENCRYREPYCEEAIRLPFGCCCEKWELREIKENEQANG